MNGERDWLLFMGRGGTNRKGGRGVSDVLPLPKGGWVSHAEGGGGQISFGVVFL